MFLLAPLSVLGVVTLGPQVVLGGFKFSFSSVNQCEPVDITFSGSDANNHSVPTTLTILPLLDNVPPIQIPIPNGSSNSTGIQLTFIPLAAGMRFIASLDDIQGPTAKVSDVIGVQNSTAAEVDSSCFGSSTPQVNFYEFDDVLGQCENFTITHNTTDAPSIRAFTPRGGSFVVIKNNGTTPPGTASYTMNGQRDSEVVLLFDDGKGHLQTTKLITISGDNTSPNSCFKPPSANDSNPNATTGSKTSAGLPKGAIIGLAVGAAIVGLLAILLLIYFLRVRRRNRRDMDMNFDPALLNRRWPPEERKIDISGTPAIAAPPSPFSAGDGFVRDPIYTTAKYASSMVSSAPRTSISSWNQFIPDDPPVQGEMFRGPSIRPSVSSSRLSMNTVDIQNILQMATVHQDHPSRGPAYQGRPTPSTAGTSTTTFPVAKPATARLASRSRTSDPPDLPATVSRNNSASAAAIAGIPTDYVPTSYMSMGDSSDDEGGSRTPRQSDGGIGGYPVPTFKTVGNPRDTSESWGNVVVR